MDSLKTIKDMIFEFYPFIKEKLSVKTDPDINLIFSEKASMDPWGKTAHYDPDSQLITLFYANRHPKDVIRSLAHELVHHKQKENGKLEPKESAGQEKYSEELEGEAYMVGNLVFREFDELKKAKKTNINEKKEASHDDRLLKMVLERFNIKINEKDGKKNEEIKND